MVKETLYKKDSKGKILEWGAEVVQNSLGVSINILAGEYEGTLTITSRDNIKGKNIGKQNETSPLEQATKEVESLYKRKRRQGYKSLIDLKYPFEEVAFKEVDTYKFLIDNLKFSTTDLDGNLKPMKAQQYYRSKKNWIDPTGKEWDDRKYYYLLNPYVPKEKNAIITKFPCLIQPKINGVRCTVSLDNDGQVQLLSKEGLKYNLPHITDIFEANKEMFAFKKEKSGEEIDVIYDGELYIPNESLQVISSAVKASNLNTPRVEYHAFDLAIEEFDNLTRWHMLKQAIDVINSNSLFSPVTRIQSFMVYNDDQVQEKTDMFIQQGYEGSILRAPSAMYMFGKRPMTMTKLKRTMSAEFEIIDIVPQDKNPELGLFVCRTKEGKEFKVTPKGDTDFKTLILFQKHIYIGKPLTCTFYEYTDDGKPFHVLDNIVRDYE